MAVLQWAREHGCRWDEDTCYCAARGGHLEVLIWAVEHGCPWVEETSVIAASGGHLEVLKWAVEHGCPWNASVCAHFAYGKGHVEMLQWVRAQPVLDVIDDDESGGGHVSSDE